MIETAMPGFDSPHAAYHRTPTSYTVFTGHAIKLIVTSKITTNRTEPSRTYEQASYKSAICNLSLSPAQK